jgi:hypothetical protein
MAAAAAVLLASSHGYANILSTTATVRANNSLLVDVQVSNWGLGDKERVK